MSEIDNRRFYIYVYRKALANERFMINDNEVANRCFKGKMMKRVVKKNVVEVPEQNPWMSGFEMFKRRIGEQLQMNGFSDGFVDDEDLLPLYRMGESETYVLAMLGCAMP